MSAFSEQEPISPQDPLHYAPRRRGERSNTHLRSVTSSAGERFNPPAPFNVDALDSPFALPASLDAEFEDAFGQTLRRHLDPQVMPEPAEFIRERPRRNKLWMAGSIVFAVGVAAIAALLLVRVLPAWRDHGAVSGLAAAMEFALPHEAAPAAPRSIPVSGEGNHEQSQQLLERFIRWRQKTDASQHQQ